MPTVVLEGQLMLGFSVPLTVTVKLQFASAPPHRSTLTTCTVVVPTSKKEPEAGVAVAPDSTEKSTMAPQSSLSLSTSILGGQDTVIGVSTNAWQLEPLTTPPGAIQLELSVKRAKLYR